jgi:hypothetical protein
LREQYFALWRNQPPSIFGVPIPTNNLIVSLPLAQGEVDFRMSTISEVEADAAIEYALSVRTFLSVNKNC